MHGRPVHCQRGGGASFPLIKLVMQFGHGYSDMLVSTSNQSYQVICLVFPDVPLRIPVMETSIHALFFSQSAFSGTLAFLQRQSNAR